MDKEQTLKLQGQQHKQFRDAFLAAFPPARFGEMLLFQLNIRRTDIARGDSKEKSY